MAKYLLFAAAMICLCVPASATLQCDINWDSRAYDDGYWDFCWLSGNVCYVCWDEGTAEGCSQDWGPCNPYPPQPEHQTAELFPDARPASPCLAKLNEPYERQARLAAKIL